eukprot:1091327-Rhodomonas_salina.1
MGGSITGDMGLADIGGGDMDMWCIGIDVAPAGKGGLKTCVSRVSAPAPSRTGCRKVASMAYSPL